MELTIQKQLFAFALDEINSSCFHKKADDIWSISDENSIKDIIRDIHFFLHFVTPQMVREDLQTDHNWPECHAERVASYLSTLKNGYKLTGSNGFPIGIHYSHWKGRLASFHN